MAKKKKKEWMSVDKATRSKAEAMVDAALELLKSDDEKDAKKAVKKLERSADLGDPEAKFVLAEMYRTGTVLPKSDVNAFPLYLDAAKEGNADAQLWVAFSYKQGRGVAQDIARAYKWLKRSAKRGNVDAEGILGMSYMEGVDLPQSHADAIKWLKSAGAMGDVASQRALLEYAERLLPEEFRSSEQEGDGGEIEDEHRAIVEAIRLADDEVDLLAEALCEIGFSYADGEFVDKSDKKAALWFLLSAMLDDARGEYALANCLYAGAGTAQSDDDAFSWMEKSALAGYPDAEYALSLFYKEGIGVKASDEEAVKWMEMAAEDGIREAMYSLGVWFEDKDVPLEVAKSSENCSQMAVKWYMEAASCGMPEAQYRLAKCYEYGLGVEMSPDTAARLFKQPAESGYIPAMYDLATCYECGIGVEPSEKMAEEWRERARRAEGGQGRTL